MESVILLYQIFIFLSDIGDALSAYCVNYTYGPSYCSGYCSGYSGSQYCIYYHGSYIFSGGSIAGLVIGLLIAAGVFITILVVCMKNYNRRHRTVGSVVGANQTRTNIAVTTTTNPAFMNPTNNYGYSGPPPQYNSVYPPQQLQPPSYPSIHHSYSAPALPQYNSPYNTIPANYIPPAS